MSDQTDTDDKLMETTVSVSECAKTNVLQLNSSLNIISRKPSGNTVFIVPQQNTSSDDTESLSQLMSTFSPPSSALVEDKKIANNKLTLIPLNLNSQPSHSSIKLSGSTTPVKSLNEPSMKAIISPVISSKKVIISTPSSGLNHTAIKTTSVNLSASNSGSNDKPIVTPLNNRLSSATNTKIFTISTQNNLKTLSQQPSITNSNNSLPQQNISTINATSITNNPNKIQYVKIVNTANNTQHIQMHQQTIPTTVTTTKPALLATNNKAIKITTISANTNNNSIITTTTNNKNDNNNNINNNNTNDNISLNNNSSSNNNISTHSMLNSLDLNTTNTNRSFSSILSSVTPVATTSTASPITKQQQTTELKNAEQTDALFESANNNSNQSNSSVKLHTYQLVSSNQPKITATAKTPMIQRIQSVNQYNNQPITKTILSATAASNSNSSCTQPQQLINNYKVLTQQLPATSSTQFTFKSLNTTNPNNLNKISITKNFSSNNSLDDLTTNRKQIITTVRNGDQSKQPITQIASSSTFINKNNSLSLSVSTVNPTNINNSNALEDNQKVEAFSKIFNTASPSTLASSSSSIQNNSPGKQRLNLNRNSGNYDQALASPPSTTSNQTQLNSSSAIPSNLSSNNRKPCNCTKSMCLKLYCDCFAMGSFCHDCNCINCFNTLEHEDERNKAIKMVLDRNPQAFQSKIGKFTAQIALQKPALSEEPMSVTAAVAVNTEEIDEIQSRHIKGCNCKKSNCLKRYCECYLAKIQCSTLCKCVGCKNCDESTKNLIQMANASDMRKQQNINQQNPFLKNNKILKSHEDFQNSLLNASSLPSSSSTFWKNNSMNRFDISSRLNSFNSFDLIPRKNQDQIKLEQQQNLNRSYAILTNDAIEVTCSRLIDKVAEEMSRLNKNHSENNESSSHMMDLENGLETNDSENNELMETLIIEEFGRCLLSLIETAEKRDKF